MILISVGCNQKHEERRGDEGRGDMWGKEKGNKELRQAVEGREERQVKENTEK